VEFGHVFAHGAFAAGGFEPMRDFDASSGDRFLQAKDRSDCRSEFLARSATEAQP
jgi:hypothetical protein